MKKYQVHGRIRAEIYFKEIVEAKSENAAVKIAEKKVYARCGFDSGDVIDEEIYCDEVQ